MSDVTSITSPIQVLRQRKSREKLKKYINCHIKKRFCYLLLLYNFLLKFLWHTCCCNAMSSASLGTDDPSSLARYWESNFHLRERIRDREDEKGRKISGRLIAWPDRKRKVATMASIAMNIYVLRMLAMWWCPQSTKPKSPSVKVLKHQAMVSK